MEINIHHYIHYQQPANQHNNIVIELLHSIINKLNTMPTKQEFQEQLTALGDALTNISDDITRLTDSLQSGGLSADEETEVFNQLRGIADTAKQLADRTVDPSTGGGGTGTTEPGTTETPTV